MRFAFVKSTMEQLVADDVLSDRDSVLVVAGGHAERELFKTLRLREVTISNLDDRMVGSDVEPFRWAFENAQDLTFEDESFDFSFVSDGLHHCNSPHRALLEMYRVSRRGIIVFESRDSLLMRLANRLNLSPNYELEAVVDNDFVHGGVNNTAIPNYIYRWTEREFKKTIQSYNPVGRHTFHFFYGLNLPYSQAEMKKRRFKYLAVRMLDPFVKLATRIFKSQCNSFCMVALKPALPDDLWPWLAVDGGDIQFSRNYAERKFKAPG